MARRVIEAVGSGDRTHADIAAEAGSRAGVIPSGTLSPVLHRLVAEKHVLAVDEPLSVRAGKPMLYRVADTNLRFYLGIGRSAQELIRRAGRRLLGRCCDAGGRPGVGAPSSQSSARPYRCRPRTFRGRKRWRLAAGGIAPSSRRSI